MPQFRYSAMGRDGKALNGVIDADTRPQAIASLADSGAFVTRLDAANDIDAAAASWFVRRVSLREKTAMLQQIAVALQAGLQLLDAVRVVEQQAETRALRNLTGDLAQRIQEGEALSEAMGAHPRQFQAMEISMVRVGETAGKLDEVMGYLAQFAVRDLDVREKIRSALAYPIFVLVLAVISVVIVLTIILPRIMAAVLEQTGTMLLPWPTRSLLAISDFVRSPWGVAVMLIMIVAGAMLIRWWRTAEGRLAVDQFILRVPVIGRAVRKVAVSRFARTLGTLSRAGIPIVEALHVLRGTLGNEALAQHVDRATADITQGQSIAEPLRQTGEFPPLLIQVIVMGERTGKLDEMLLQAADTLERETAAALQRVMAILPAVFIVCLALVVVFILAAVLLPVMNIDIAAAGG